MGVLTCEWLVLGSWSYGVMVSTLDFESSDPGSSPGRTSFLLKDDDVFSQRVPAATISMCKEHKIIVQRLIACPFR
jgi:hypothetical protein